MDVGIIKVVKETIAEILEIQEHNVKVTSSLEELGADALDIMNILESLEAKLDTVIMEYEHIKKVSDLIGAFQKALSL